MLKVLDEQNYRQVSYFLKILIPHCVLSYIQCEVEARIN
jgi:hypothetical protein